jgi:serine phosphatase RsbU (regulator of sigma subunit)
MGAMDDDDDESAMEKTNIFSRNTGKVLVEPDFQVPPCLVLLVGPQEQMGRQWVIDKASLSLGRNANADIQISETSLSKLHARIEVVNNKVFITDLGSTNSTLIDTQKLVPNQAYALKNNDQIRAGSLVFKFLERGILSETTEKARMQSELEKARSVQESLFPPEAEAHFQWVKIVGRYQAASECGGDWWWRWSSADKAFAFIGDATGHGAAAALITSAARSAIATMEHDPSTAIEKVYATLSHAIRTCSGGRLTMSAFIVEVNLKTRVMRYINASHLPAVVLPKRGPAPSWKSLTYLIDPISSSLGSSEQNIAVGTCVAPFNSRLVLLTDGLTERADRAGEPLNERVFNNMLIQNHQAHVSSPTGFLDAMIQQSDQLAQQAPLEDDITVVALDFD